MASKKNKDYYLSDEDRELFLQAFYRGAIHDANKNRQEEIDEKDIFLHAVKSGKIPIKKEYESKKNIIKKTQKNKDIDAKIDLHGMFLEDAVLSLYKFIDEQRRLGKKILLVVHGKGRGTLREGALGVISTHPAVFNYKIAPMRHGGDGAMIVWLK